jgi:hypothetical protein
MAERTPLIGVFTSSRQAGRAVHELRRAGFRGGQLEVVEHEKSPATERVKARVKRGTRTVESAPADAVHQVLDPRAAAAPAPVGGPGAAASPTANGAVGSLLDSVRQVAAAAADAVTSTLAGMGFMGDEADFYTQEFRAGRTLVVVRVRRRREEAAAVLRRCGASDARNPRGGQGNGEPRVMPRGQLPGGKKRL